MSKFKCGDIVRHLKTGDLYIVMHTPDGSNYRLEKTDEPAYIYWLSADHHSGDAERLLIKWIRSQKEMEEEGRFELVKE